MDFSAKKDPDHLHCRMVRCEGCGLLYSTPILEDYEVTKLYEESTFVYDQDSRNLEETYGAVLKEVEAVIPAKENLLDIGCSNGFFLDKALHLGWQNVYGVEPAKEAVAIAPPSVKDHIKLGIFDPNDWPKDSFDVVFFAMVIEHIADVNGFLSGMKSLLKEGGVVLGIAHDERSLLSRLLKSRCPIINDEHVYVFDRQTLGKIFSKHGFKVIKIAALGNIYSLNYWLKMLPLPKFAKKAVRWFFRVTRLGEINLRLKAGNIYIIAQKLSQA